MMAHWGHVPVHQKWTDTNQFILYQAIFESFVSVTWSEQEHPIAFCGLVLGPWPVMGGFE